MALIESVYITVSLQLFIFFSTHSNANLIAISSALYTVPLSVSLKLKDLFICGIKNAAVNFLLTDFDASVYTCSLCRFTSICIRAKDFIISGASFLFTFEQDLSVYRPTRSFFRVGW